MGNPRYSNGHRRRELQRWLKAQGRGCWICREFGLPDRIDYDAGPLEPRSFNVDELRCVSAGGDPLDRGNVDSAHRACNLWRGNKSVAEVKRLAALFKAGGLSWGAAPPFARQVLAAHAAERAQLERRVTSRSW